MNNVNRIKVIFKQYHHPREELFIQCHLNAHNDCDSFMTIEYDSNLISEKYYNLRNI